jgi:sigma-B regulation protein RsbU (phosphoserine phosphatase)
LLVSYSDGVTEATSPTGEMFGLDRLMALTQTLLDLPASLVAQTVRDKVMEYAEGRPLGDDLTVLSIRIAG